MAKKLIQRAMQRLSVIPGKDNIAQNKSLKFLGDKLHQPHLWHINRHSVARAFAVGGFAMYTPPLPWQMVIAAVLAVYFEANLPIAVALVWITNPFTWIPLYYIAYSLGAILLGAETYSFSDFQSVFSSLGDAWEKLGAPFLLGCFGMMVICSIAGYFGIQAFWRHHVLKAWEERKQQRREGIRRTFEAMSGEEPVDASANATWMASVLSSLEAAWRNIIAPFVAHLAAAGNAGLQAALRYFRIMNAWQKRQQRRQAQQPATTSAPGAQEPLSGEPPSAAAKAFAEAWQNLAVPFIAECLRIAALCAGAGQCGAQAFWRDWTQGHA